MIANDLGPDGRLTGKEAFKQFYDEFRQQLGHVQVTVSQVLHQEDTECALCHVRGTFLANQAPVEFTGTTWVRIREGRIAEAWNHFDFLKMYMQAGYALQLP